MRNLSPAMLTLLNTQEASEPILILKTQWGTKSAIFAYYATKTILPLIGGRILQIGTLSAQKQSDSSATVASTSVTLDDSNGSIKFEVDHNPPETGSGRLYLAYEGLPESDWILLCSGRLSNPLWDEGNRAVTFQLESRIEEDEIGYSATPDDFPDMANSAIDTPWPMIFGKCAHVPALKIREKITGHLTFGLATTSTIYKRVSKTNIDFEDVTPKIQSILASDPDALVENKIQVTGGEKFPQGTSIKLLINGNDDLSSGLIIQGSFEGEVFTITDPSVPKFTNLAVETSFPFGTRNYYDLRLAQDTNILNHFCYIKIGSKTHVNYCTSYNNKFATFKYPFMYPLGPGAKNLIGKTVSITKVYSVPPNLTSDDLFLAIAQVFETTEYRTGNGSGIIEAAIKNLIERRTSNPETRNNIFWSADAGARVTIWNNNNDPDIYVASLVPMTSIKAVFGHKKVNIQGKQKTLLSPIPKEYYTKKLQDNDYLGATTITFKIPLKELENEVWDDEVYVSGVSSVGPNVVDIIAYLAFEYSDFIIDGDSFSTARSLVNSRPANFALFERTNVLQLLSEIAFQAKLGIVTEVDTLKIKYLAQYPAATKVINEDLIFEESLETSHTPIENIVTKSIYSWNSTYREVGGINKSKNKKEQKVIELVDRLKKDTEHVTQVVTYSNNIDIYGLRRDDERIYIYNQKDYVVDTSRFWGYRKSNCWKLASFSTTLGALVLDIFDGVQIESSLISATHVVGIVEKLELNFNQKEINLSVWLPVRAGQVSVDTKAFTGDLGKLSWTLFPRYNS